MFFATVAAHVQHDVSVDLELRLLQPLTEGKHTWRRPRNATFETPAIIQSVNTSATQTLGLGSQRPWGHQHWVCTSLGRPAPLPHPSYYNTRTEVCGGWVELDVNPLTAIAASA